ncbi:MAG: ATP-binding cassette domain-containing protein [Desulfotalea sp.]
MKKDTLLSIKNVVKEFDISGGLLEQIKFKNNRFVREETVVHALNDISFDIGRGETVSVVGESGCGKSTLARCVIRLHNTNSGEILYEGKRIDNLSHNDLKPYRRKMQMVFQDPYSSLNPRMTVESTLEEPIRFHNKSFSKSDVKDKVAEVMQHVGIDPLWRTRFPHEFSGGQRQRISIARALAVDPEFIVADEPIAALDVSIQAQVLNLLMDLQEKHGLTYMFISHDLSVVEHISTEVAVMYLGTLCEFAETETLYKDPKHPYTKALLSAIPQFGQKGFSHLILKGDVPTPINLPTGCVFHGRCPEANTRCRAEIPKPIKVDNGSIVACHAVEENRI